MDHASMIFSASLIASFFAGMVALFAPCCITVLLPTYLASVFREKKNVMKMTFIFFAGIAVILIPIGLGAASLARIFRSYHNEMYVIGGLFMFLLGAMALAGKGIAMIPMPKRAAALNPSSAKSVFALGMFSGAATSCCAPVLAGMITLAVISGAFWKALAVTFAYVFGMTFPLFLSAYFYEKYDVSKSKLIRGKLIMLNIGKKRLAVHSTNLISAVIFVLIGGIMLFLGISHNTFWAPKTQGNIGALLNAVSIKIIHYLSFVPEIIWGTVMFAVFIIMLKMVFSKRQQEIIISQQENEHDTP